MRNNRFVCICRALTKGKNSPRTTFVIWTLSALIIFSFLHLVNVLDLVSIATSEDVYGKYSMRIPYNESYEKLKDDSRVDDTILVNFNCIEYDGDYYNTYSAEERILEFINVSLVEGEYPTADNEIAVDRSYMYRIGLTEEEMLGSSVDILGSEYIVTGVIVRNVCGTNSAYSNVEYSFLTSNTTGKYTDVFIEIVDLKDYKDVIDSLINDYQIDGRKCYINYNLFLNKGYFFEDVNGTINGIIYMFFVLIMLIVIHTLNNHIKIWMNNIADDIANMGIMGISFKTMAGVLIVYFMASIVVCLLVGSALALLVAIAIWKTNSELITFKQVLQCIPKDVLVNIIVVYIIVAFVQLLWLLLPLIRCNANKLKREGNILLVGKKYRFRKHFLSMGKTSFVTSIYKKNARENRPARWGVVFGIGIATTLFVLGMYYSKLQMKTQGYKVNMDYRVEFVPEAFLNSRERMIQKSIYKSLERGDEYVLHPIYNMPEDVKLSRDELGNDYLKYLWEVVDSSRYRFYKSAQNFTVRIMVIGYDERQLKELYSINNLPYRKLNNGEMLVLDRTVPFVGDKGFDVNIDNELIIGESSFKTVGEVDKLLTYETSYNNKICVIISEDEYQSMYNVGVPTEVFVTANSDEALKKAEKKLVGSSLLELEKPKETYGEYEKSNIILNGLIFALVGVMLMPVMSSVYSGLSLRFHTNKMEYQLYNVMGISKNKSITIFVLEIVISIIWGIIISLPVVYFITRNMMKESFGKAGLFYYDFPYEYYFYLVIVYAIMICIMSIVVRRKINSIGMVRA